jgi:hypothetical protein
VAKSSEVDENKCLGGWSVGGSRFGVRDNTRELRLAVGGDLTWCSDDHGLFYCLDIAITNNKKNRQRSCTDGQDIGRCSQSGDATEIEQDEKNRKKHSPFAKTEPQRVGHPESLVA